jgi:hypothetical protein
VSTPGDAWSEWQTDQILERIEREAEMAKRRRRHEATYWKLAYVLVALLVGLMMLEL